MLHLTLISKPLFYTYRTNGAREMTKSQMFNAAHQEAKLSLKFAYFLTYRQAFANALRGFHAVANGFTGAL